jgi:hypothetical protein
MKIFWEERVSELWIIDAKCIEMKAKF